MRRLESRILGRVVWPFVMLFLGLPLSAQDVDLVSSQVSVSSSNANLELEFTDGRTLRVALEDGRVLIDGSEVGPFESGDALDQSWRGLLSSAISLSGDELVERLRDWAPPEMLDGETALAAEQLDLALAGASGPTAMTPTAPPTPGSERQLLRLLRYADQLGRLGETLDDLELDELLISVGEDLDVVVGESIDKNVLVAGGDLNVAGRVDGDVIVIDGSLTIRENAEIAGNVRLLDARLRNDGDVAGRVQRIREQARETELDLGELREQIRADIEREIERGVDRGYRSSRGFWSPFRNVARAVGGVFENLLTFGIMIAIGAVLLHFGGGRMEVIASTARAFPARSAAVGLAGAFLFIPAWILGIVALAITIIGIPVAVAWAPLFPLAVGILAVAGALAVAMNVGEWVGENRIRGFEWAARPNTLYRMAAGLLGITLIFMAANVLQVAGSLLGFLNGLLTVVGVLAVQAITIVGFGAVLLSRGGSRPDLVGEHFSFEDWRHGWRNDRWHRSAHTATEPEPPVDAAPDFATAQEDFEAAAEATVEDTPVDPMPDVDASSEHAGAETDEIDPEDRSGDA